MRKVTPFLWFDNNAEEAAKFYTATFKNSKIKDIAKYDKGGAEASGRPLGSVMTVSFEIEGQEFVGLNGGPVFKFSPAVSFMVTCETQEEIDRLWEKLAKGGQEQQCGWITDKFGVTWQICPSGLDKMLQDKDKKKAERAWKAMVQMVKLDIKKLRKAYEG